MQNGQITIFGLLDGTKIFRIPQYQRAFAWEKHQLGEFVTDLENQVPDKAYFYGTILFREIGQEGEFETIEIVDGQQRLTTLIIYIKLILDRLRAVGQDVDLLTSSYVRYGGRYKLQVLNDDNLFFEKYILESKDGSNFINTPSQRRLWYARTFLEDRVAAYPVERLQQILAIIKRTVVLVYSVADNAEATLIFEMTNDRGKRLTNLEKTKSFLMHKTYLVSDVPEHDLQEIQQQFVEIYRDVEDMQDKDFGEDSILQYHFIAHETWWSNNQQKQYAKYVELVKAKVNALFLAPDHAGTRTYIRQYVQELRETYRVMKILLLHPERYGLLDIKAMGRLATFLPLLIKTFKLDHTPEKGFFKRIVRLCEIISFRVWGIRRRRSNAGRDWLYSLARDFKGDFTVLISQLIHFIEQYSSPAEFRRYLLSRHLYEEASSSDLRYLFWKYENYLRQQEVPQFADMSYETFMPADSRLRYSIEHIAPQNPNESRVVADAGILPQLTEDFKNNWLHQLGNLTFDPILANKQKSNSPVPEKNQRFFQKAPLKTQNELSDFLSEGGRWDEESIRRRSDKIAAFAFDYWDPHKV